MCSRCWARCVRRGCITARTRTDFPCAGRKGSCCWAAAPTVPAKTARAKALFPRSREGACWSAQDCITLDGIPYIGPFSAATPRWLVATGFGKWGMTSSMVAAQINAGTICSKPPVWARVFSPARFHLSASAQNLSTDTVQAFKGLVLETLHLPDETVSALPPGHGGIIAWNGRKAGVYKDEAGEVFAVYPR